MKKAERFDASLLSAEYAKKSSMARYRELLKTFPNVLILFEHDGNYYGFDETAVALHFLFGYPNYRKEEMFVMKVEKAKFEAYAIAKKQMCGYCYVVDRDGVLSFERGKKRFRLQKPLSAYEEILHPKQKKVIAPSYWSDPGTSRGGYDGPWTPGLPSSRFYRKKT